MAAAATGPFVRAGGVFGDADVAPVPTCVMDRTDLRWLLLLRRDIETSTIEEREGRAKTQQGRRRSGRRKDSLANGKRGKARRSLP